MNFIAPAFAQAAGTPPMGDLVMQMAPFAIILVIMYFLILRPQQKRARSHQDMVKNVRRGDTVITSGGIVAKVSRTIDDAEVEIEIAPNVKVRQLRHLITEVRSKGEPVKE
jgi:preprotein translocase subunit YajC